MDFFHEVRQNNKIGTALNESRSAKQKANSSQLVAERLEERLDKMSLVCQALLEIVQERLGFTNSDLEEKILEIDLRDGNADGKIGGTVIKCPNCGQSTNSRREKCIFCGSKTEKESKFG